MLFLVALAMLGASQPTPPSCEALGGGSGLRLLVLVKHEPDSVLAGAVVSVVQDGRGSRKRLVAERVTDARGSLCLALQPGRYAIQVQLSGLKTLTLQNVEVKDSVMQPVVAKLDYETIEIDDNDPNCGYAWNDPFTFVIPEECAKRLPF